MSQETLDVSDERITVVAKALSSKTRIEILKMTSEKDIDVSRIAGLLNQTEANISAQIKILEQAGLLISRYEPGMHGVRKICSTKIDTVIFKL
ncbi:MAG TPA: ArsR family transcriptional regulator [candidate division Zixibacteria bacterium]|nr:ArsR family transcriptional regulator [candidate division Zixibacteria bacterium]